MIFRRKPQEREETPGEHALAIIKEIRRLFPNAAIGHHIPYRPEEGFRLIHPKVSKESKAALLEAIKTRRIGVHFRSEKIGKPVNVIYLMPSKIDRSAAISRMILLELEKLIAKQK